MHGVDASLHADVVSSAGALCLVRAPCTTLPCEGCQGRREHVLTAGCLGCIAPGPWRCASHLTLNVTPHTLTVRTAVSNAVPYAGCLAADIDPGGGSPEGNGAVHVRALLHGACGCLGGQPPDLAGAHCAFVGLLSHVLSTCQPGHLAACTLTAALNIVCRPQCIPGSCVASHAAHDPCTVSKDWEPHCITFATAVCWQARALAPCDRECLPVWSTPQQARLQQWGSDKF